MGVILIKKPGVPAKEMRKVIKRIERIYTKCAFGHYLLRDDGEQSLFRKGTYANGKYSTLTGFGITDDHDFSVVSFTHWAGDLALNKTTEDQRPPFRMELMGNRALTLSAGRFVLFLTHYPVSIGGLWSNDNPSQYIASYQNEFFRKALQMGNFERAFEVMPGLDNMQKAVMCSMDGGTFIRGEDLYHNYNGVLISSSHIRDELVKQHQEAVFTEDLPAAKRIDPFRSSYLTARDTLLGLREHILLYRTSEENKDLASREKFVLMEPSSISAFPLILKSLSTGETIQRVYLDIKKSFKVYFKNPLHDV